jgi:hypothetical protein
MRSRASVRPWPRPWLRVLRIRRHSDQDATSQPGSGWCQSSIRAGKEKLGSISKQGDRYLRSLFTAGALAVIRYAKIYGTAHRPWLTALLARRPTKVAAIALANKLERWPCTLLFNVPPARISGENGEQFDDLPADAETICARLLLRPAATGRSRGKASGSSSHARPFVAGADRHAYTCDAPRRCGLWRPVSGNSRCGATPRPAGISSLRLPGILRPIHLRNVRRYRRLTSPGA